MDPGVLHAPEFQLTILPRRNAADALENINDISEGILNEYLRSNLELNLPKASAKSPVTLAVQDKNLGGAIKAAFPGIDAETADTSDIAADLLRGVRTHAEKLLKGLQDGDVSRAQLGLGHAYSRGKVKFNVHKNDNHSTLFLPRLERVTSFARRAHSLRSSCY